MADRDSHPGDMNEITSADHDRQWSRARPVVVGVDESATAIRAAQWAAVVADARRAPLWLVHVVGRHADASASEEILADARRAVLERWTRTSSTPAPTINTFALRGDPATRLAELSARACEVVVGSAGRRARGRPMLGSVPATLVATAHAPVAVIRPPASGAATVGPVLVVTAAADTGAFPVVAAAMRAAAERRCELLVVAVTRPGARTSAARAEENLEAMLAAHEHHFPTVRARLVTYFGHPRTAIEKFGATAQLVVTGRQRKSRLPQLGGTTHHALHHTRCAVLVVPERSTKAIATPRSRFAMYNRRRLPVEQTVS